MPRVDFKLWDRVYILKLICTAQATYSSFIVLIYVYLIILQDWNIAEDDRSDIRKLKWSVIAAGTLDFGLGILLAFAANMSGIRCKLRIVIWIISETFLIPISIFLLMQLQKRLNNSNKFETDTHYARVNIGEEKQNQDAEFINKNFMKGLIPAQVCFLLAQYVFIAYAIDFLVQGKRRVKTYDPSIRPTSVYAPTDPQITTTESRHIRMSQSLLFQPSSSRALWKNSEREESVNSDEIFKKELSEKDETKLRSGFEFEISRVHKRLEAEAKIESFLFENKKKIHPRQEWGLGKEDSKDEEWLKEGKVEWLQSENREKEYAKDQEKEWTEDEKKWRRDENYWVRDEREVVNKERDFTKNKEKLEWAELEGKRNEETKPKDSSNESENEYKESAMAQEFEDKSHGVI